MNRSVLFALLICPMLSISQSSNYFQQRADFSIDVSLDPISKTLDGLVSLNYTNNSPDTLHYIWFHLWPNAYKNDQTAFSEQFLQSGRTDFYFSDEAKRGYINKLNFTVDGKPAVLEDHPLYIDVAKLILPSALSPGKTVNIRTPFHEKLPYLFSRGGYDDDFFMITQWYPKPAVYDRRGWHPMPYLDQGEFYSEFGDYQVNVTIPKEYTVAGTGKITQREETPKEKTLTFYQNDVHDFAWFAGKDLQKDSIGMKSVSGKTIMLYAYYKKDNAGIWKNSTGWIKQTIKNREQDLGPYPYSIASIVEAPSSFKGGMEYPAIASIQPTDNEKTLIELIDHEVGHFWTYGILATNERDAPWMDEGMTSFYTNRLSAEKSREAGKNFLKKRLPDDYDGLIFRNQVAQKKDQPLNLPAQDYSATNYYSSIYYKAAAWMKQLENFLGAQVFQHCMRDYYNKWKFRHPYPEDFKNVIAEVSGKNVDSIFSLLNTRGNIVPERKKEFRLQSFFDLRETDRYNYLFVSPSAGFNYYDGLMAGIMVHNYTLPEPPLHFFLSPMMGMGSKKFAGIGRIGYTKTSYGKIRKFETSVAAAKFDMDEFTDSRGKKNFMDFSKLVPSAKITFRNKNPLSHVQKYLQWKTYFIRETSLLFTLDTIHQINVATYPKSSRYLNELTYSFLNDRALYPFSYRARIHQGDGFLRLTLDAGQYFNYPKGGGLNTRLFGGKLFYTDNATPRYVFQRYRFNMTGPNGDEDYTYANYFIGRNEFEGISSQQIMIRDGGFKVRTDLLSNKVGTSDNWLAAINLDTDIPGEFNPLQILPFNLNLKAFLDIGTYSGAWENNAGTGRILYDAGLQVGLFKDIIRVYVPIIYSKVYGDYFKSTIPKKERFWKTISFSIDIQRFSMKSFAKIPN